MPQFIVSGYSGKTDGIIYVVQADNKVEAFKKVALLRNGRYVSHIVTDDGEWDLLVFNNTTDNQLMEMLNDGHDIRWQGYILYGQEVIENENISEVACF